jgi:hypothetical protein
MDNNTHLYKLSMKCLFLLMAATTAFGRVIYVDIDATGINDGSSWANAYNYLQDALVDANSAEKPVEIRVAEGIYKPDQGAHQTPGSPTATFQLINGVTIKGGYAGFGEPNQDARDIALHQTILSGDIGRPSDKSDNCFHVFYHPEGLNLDDTAILDGFTITSGNANSYSWPHYYGGGMCNWDNSSPMVTNCTFTANSAGYRGGGMFNDYSSPTVEGCTFSGNASKGGGGMYNDYSSPTVTNCTFTVNSAKSGGGIFNDYNSSPAVTNCTFSANSAKYGGGMYNYDNSSPAVTNCTFTANSAKSGGGIFNDYNSSPAVTNCTFTANSAIGDFSGGGGMYNGGDSLTVTNCTFSNNSANWGGGGMYNSSNPTVDGCTFSANSAKYGGGMYNYDNSSPAVTNCTFSGNSANWGGGGMFNYYESSPTVTNCILWGNTAPNGPQIYNYSSNPAITYSDIEGGWTGTGNINADPCFASSGYWDPNGTPADANDDFWVDGDYHLKSQAGRWEPATQAWIRDDVTSPGIDAGDPSSPIGLEPFPNGGIINMGAYGGTEEASKSYFGEPVCETIIAGDINGDCKVNLLDFALIALHWLEDNTPQPPGQASNPWPNDGAMSVDLEVDLSWTAGTNALSHDVYFGTDANALASADRMAPEYRGNRTFTKFDPELLTRYTTHYWRIDEIGSVGITKGIVWRFTTGDARPKGMTCFPADTLVWVDGALVQISKVVAGQMVGKTNCLAEASGIIEAVQVHEGSFECRDIVLNNGNTISVVDSHCFLLDSGRWVAAQDLKSGLKLKSLNGPVAIKSITTRPAPFVGRVYNLKIKYSDRYFVGRNGLIVRDY